MNTLSITVDIEEWYHIPSVTGSPFAVYKDVNEFFKGWSGKYNYLSEPTKRVRDLLDEYDIKATFFVVADVVEHYPGLVESIAERGHEIGCHGLHHACKIDPKTKKQLMSVKEFEGRTLEAKETLERVCKEEVIGYRVGDWMLDALEKIGFKYDSSISANSLYNKTDSSLEGVSSYPYYPKKNGLEVGEEKGKKIVEFPWAYWNVFGFNFKIPTSGGPMLRFLGAHVILK
jgi:peptidoglycan/xylan/chitin deacetylase (PgdA/CDA1 family)